MVAQAGSPNSPRTPLLGRSISGQFGSPSAYRSEQEDCIVWELGARHLSAGFSGESRPRCTLHFGPESERRVGDFRVYDQTYQRKRQKVVKEEGWGREYELYRSDLRTLDLGLVEDKLERAVRTVHTDHLQLDQKPRKAVLAMPSLLPTPLLEIALKVLFNHFSQPPSLVLLTTPILACVGAGLRYALVVDIGWEETAVTAVGEYKEVNQRRSVRAGKVLTWEMAKMLEGELEQGDSNKGKSSKVTFEYAEEVTQRMGWCAPLPDSSTVVREASTVDLPLPSSTSSQGFKVPFAHLSKSAENAFFTSNSTGHDDHDLPLHVLAYQVLLAVPLDLRTLCISRIVFTGGASQLPGLKIRLLQELDQLVGKRGWDLVRSYGSATAHHEKVLKERSANIARQSQKQQTKADVPLSPAKKPLQESIPHSERIHDDTHDPLSQKAEREANRGKAEVVKGVVRGAQTLGAWAGASLVASLRIKGVHDIERDEFLKHGFREGDTMI